MGKQGGQRYIAETLVRQAAGRILFFFLCFCMLDKIEKHGITT